MIALYKDTYVYYLSKFRLFLKVRFSRYKTMKFVHRPSVRLLGSFAPVILAADQDAVR